MLPRGVSLARLAIAVIASMISTSVVDGAALPTSTTFITNGCMILQALGVGIQNPATFARNAVIDPNAGSAQLGTIGAGVLAAVVGQVVCAL